MPGLNTPVPENIPKPAVKQFQAVVREQPTAVVIQAPEQVKPVEATLIPAKLATPDLPAKLAPAMPVKTNVFASQRHDRPNGTGSGFVASWMFIPVVLAELMAAPCNRAQEKATAQRCTPAASAIRMVPGLAVRDRGTESPLWSQPQVSETPPYKILLLTQGRDGGAIGNARRSSVEAQACLHR